MITATEESLRTTGTEADAPDADEAHRSMREVRYEHSRNLVPLLARLRLSLLVTTYQAGKLVVVGADQGRLGVSLHNFERAMGLAVRPDQIAIGTSTQVWSLLNAPDLAPRLAPVGRHDGCFLARSSHFTGEIQGHEMAWAGDELWVVNTAFSCLCTLDNRHSFVPRWRPPFISALAAEDRCHLNGLAMVDGQPKYVTTMGETDSPQGWRAGKASGGCLIDVPTGSTVAIGFAMPHSPRVYQDRVYLLDSGRGRLVTTDVATGSSRTVAELPSYTRGLAIHGGLAFVGLSKIRETSTFAGVPVADQRDTLKCGVAIVDLGSGQCVSLLEFHTGVEEIFDVQVLPGMLLPTVSGPFPTQDGGRPVWVVPDPRLGSPVSSSLSSEPRH